MSGDSSMSGESNGTNAPLDAEPNGGAPAESLQQSGGEASSETNPEPQAEAAAHDIPAGDRTAQLEAELQALKAEYDTLNGQYMRLAADFDNFRKRQSRDSDDLRLQITCSTLGEILPVVDNFDRARQQLNPQHEEAQKIGRAHV